MPARSPARPTSCPGGAPDALIGEDPELVGGYNIHGRAAASTVAVKRGRSRAPRLKKLSRRADMEREGSGPSSLLNGATPGNGSRPRDAADAAATTGKSFPGPRPPPATTVIFGAAGDLTKRLVVPALYKLARGAKLPEGFAMIRVHRNDETTARRRSNLTNMIQAFARPPRGEQH